MLRFFYLMEDISVDLSVLTLFLVAVYLFLLLFIYLFIVLQFQFFLLNKFLWTKKHFLQITVQFLLNISFFDHI